MVTLALRDYQLRIYIMNNSEREKVNSQKLKLPSGKTLKGEEENNLNWIELDRFKTC